jgi:hypothetical protein
MWAFEVRATDLDQANGFTTVKAALSATTNAKNAQILYIPYALHINAAPDKLLSVLTDNQ